MGITHQAEGPAGATGPTGATGAPHGDGWYNGEDPP